MAFLGVYRAIYDYQAQSDQELAISEGDLLYVLEKSAEDDWWKAKKRAAGEEDEEPVGLIPSNYIEEAQPTHHAKALYDYTRQTDEELSFAEDATLTVYDTSDPDWTLVGFNGEYGFAPANYIEVSDSSSASGRERAPTSSHRQHELEAELDDPEPPTPSSGGGSPLQSPAAALAGILNRKAPTTAPEASGATGSRSQTQTFTPDASDDEGTSPPAPVLPTRPASGPTSPQSVASPTSPDRSRMHSSPPHNRAVGIGTHDKDLPSQGGFHLYNVNEMVSAMGKRKKLPTTLGINTATGILMIAPEKSRDGPQQEWTAEKLTHYSIEGKHVFLDLVRPSKSVDFHAGAKDTAEEIVSALGDMAGAVRAEGLREVIAASSGSGSTQNRGQVLYDFVAQGDDEVTVGVGDEVIIVDDIKSDEWWMVRRINNGKEGVVPSSYVEVTGTTSIASPSATGINAGRSTVEQNRIEEERLAKAAVSSSQPGHSDRSPEVGPGVRLPKRGSSLMGNDGGGRHGSQRSKRDSRASASGSKSRPTTSKTRTWTDRTGSFKVDAEYIGCTDGKIHLHKSNGVKIAVPVVKMSIEDLEYVERISGLSLDEDKPLSDIRRRSQLGASLDRARGSKSPSSGRPHAGLEQSNKEEYDWFDFFLKCGVGVHQCERYASNFTRDSMDESVLPEITPTVLRTLGLKEGDILRVMKALDNKYGRTSEARAKRNVSFGGTEVMGNLEGQAEGGSASGGGGLFSGPGGALRNNTRKGRPAPPVQTSDSVDPKVFEQRESNGPDQRGQDSEAIRSPQLSPPPPVKKDNARFDDDAWDVKPSKQQKPPAQQSASANQSSTGQAPSQQQPTLTGSMQDLSLLSQPLQPTITHTTGPQRPPAQQQQFSSGLPNQSQQPQPQPQPQQQMQQPAQQDRANTSFFPPLGQLQNTGAVQQNNLPTAPSLPSFNAQQTGFAATARQRPQAPPQGVQNQGSLMLPPPPRPLSAPQNASQQSTFAPPPLQAQLTGVQLGTGNQTQLAPPGQSLNDLNQARFQQQYGQQLPQPQLGAFGQQINGLAPQATGLAQYGNGLMPQPTGLGVQQTAPAGLQPPQQFANGPASNQFGTVGQQQQPGFPSLAPQQTALQSSLQQTPTQTQQGPSNGTINSILPPALPPQRTGFNTFSPNVGQGFPPPPPIPQQRAAAPLQAQKTGPAPPVKFGVAEANKLTPQATGRKANLSQATPQNPFGF